MRFALFAFVVVVAAACEPEIGLPCDPDQDKVLARVIVAPGTNDLVKDIAFDTCFKIEGLCASVQGGRPYCTKACEADIECAEAGDGFTCQQIIDFGVLGCQDFTPLEECPKDGSFPCDCINANGEPSTKPLKYCSASPETIAARDAEFGRPKFVAP